MHNPYQDKSARERLEEVLKNEGWTKPMLAEKIGVSERELVNGVIAGDQTIIGRIDKEAKGEFIYMYLIGGRCKYGDDGIMRPY